MWKKKSPSRRDPRSGTEHVSIQENPQFALALSWFCEDAGHPVVYDITATEQNVRSETESRRSRRDETR